MIKALRYILPVTILVIGALIAYLFIANKPEPRQRNFPYQTPQVQGVRLDKTDFKIQLHTQGVVQARTQINLTAEVRGRVIEIAPNFREGGFFEAGDVLLSIDPVDYESELVVAKAALAQAELVLAQEEARFQQAERDWKRLGDDEEKPSPLVLREPQIKQARANIASAQARLRIAERNLERTKIRAPFAGRVLAKSVDVGRYVSSGNPLATIYAVDFAEVRLPLTSKQAAFLELKEIYRGDSPILENGPDVIVTYKIGDQNHNWKGKIVRAEGSIDPNSRQLFVIAQFPNPYGRSESGKPPLKVGTFVTAVIEGKLLEDVYVFPRRLLNETQFVITVDKENHLHRRYVDIIWTDKEQIIAKDGFEEGDRLCLTDVPYSLEGMAVNVDELVSIPGSKSEESERKVTEVIKRPKQTHPMIAGLLQAIPEGKELPPEYQKELEAAFASGDREKIRSVMMKIREWGASEGIEFPRGGGRR